MPFDLGHPHPNVYIPRVGGPRPLADWWFAGPPWNAFHIRQTGVYNIKAQIAYQRHSLSGSDLNWGNMKVGLRLRMSDGGVTSTLCKRLFNNWDYDANDLCDISDTMLLPANAYVWVEWLTWMSYRGDRSIRL